MEKILYNHKKDYSLTENNAVGPTTSLTLRTLDNPTPTNSNTIFLAMNGNDANNGDLATPVLTLERAIDLVQTTPTRNTIHIFRNGYVGELSVTVVDDHIIGIDPLPNDSILQVELGETCKLQLNNRLGALGLSINGFYIKYNVQGLYAIANQSFGVGFGYIRWNHFSIDSSFINNNFQLSPLVFAGELKFNVFDFSNYEKSGYIITTQNLTKINNNLFTNYIFPQGANDYGIVQLIVNTTGDIFEAQHNTFVNVATAFKLVDTSGVATFIIKNNIFNNFTRILFLQNDLFSSTLALTNNFYAYGQVRAKNIAGNFVTFSDNDYIFGISPLFFDENGGDYRLRDERRKVPNSNEYFEITSKAVYNPDLGYEPSDDNKDLGCYDVSYTLITDTWDTYTLAPEHWNESVVAEMGLTNYQTFETPLGNFKRVFDATKLRFDFTTVQMAYIGTLDSYRFWDILRSDGAKRWYPRGDDGLFTEASGALTKEPGEWDWKATLPTIWANDPLFYRMRFEGFVCELTSGAFTHHLQISDNASGALYLVDHRENQATIQAGTYQIKGLYLPVEVDQSNMPMEFLDWQPAENPLYPQNDYNDPDGDYRSYEGHVRTFTLRETDLDD